MEPEAITVTSHNDVTISPNVSTNFTYDPVCFNTEVSPEVLLSYQIELVWTLLTVIIGLVANSLNIIVFSSKNMRVISSNVYLLNLAFSDSMFLITVTLVKVITAIRCLYFPDIRFDIYNLHDVPCKLLQYLLDLFSDYSVMMILAFTVERYIACYYAIRFKELCTVKRAWIACTSIFTIICLSILPYHVACIEIIPTSIIKVCAVIYDRLETDIFFYAYICEMLIYKIGPVIIVAILNIFIIIKVLNIHKEKKMRRNLTQKHINNGKPGPYRANSQLKLKASKEDKHVQLTIILVIVSSIYIALLMPNLVYFVLNKLNHSGIIRLNMALDLKLLNYTTMLFVTAFAVNFFLYTMGGSVFRRELKSILFPKHAETHFAKNKAKKVNSNGQTGTDETEMTLI